MKKDLENHESEANPIPNQDDKPKSRVIPAEELGLSLKISRETIEEYDRIRKEQLNATLRAQEKIVLWD